MDHTPALDDRDMAVLHRAVTAYTGTLRVVGELELSKESRAEANALMHTWTRLKPCMNGTCHCSNPTLGGVPS